VYSRVIDEEQEDLAPQFPSTHCHLLPGLTLTFGRSDSQSVVVIVVLPQSIYPRGSYASVAYTRITRCGLWAGCLF